MLPHLGTTLISNNTGHSSDLIFRSYLTGVALILRLRIILSYSRTLRASVPASSATCYPHSPTGQGSPPLCIVFATSNSALPFTPHGLFPFQDSRDAESNVVKGSGSGSPFPSPHSSARSPGHVASGISPANYSTLSLFGLAALRLPTGHVAVKHRLITQAAEYHFVLTSEVLRQRQSVAEVISRGMSCFRTQGIGLYIFCYHLPPIAHPDKVFLT